MSVVHLQRAGDFFAFDTQAYRDGDLLYAEVLEIVRHLRPDIDRVGQGDWRYRVRVRCAADRVQGTPDGIDDFYAWDFVDDSCVRLSQAQMRLAAQAGWPTERAFLLKLV
jgi:hypothetical protein